jgi:UDP-N-acetylmuramoyl-L-alanyl-D-glutamate--2,6-diaminopimelate ligase
VSGDPTGLDRIGQLLESGVEFSDVVHDSRHVVAGCLFVCLRGANFDGHEFAAGAVADGAAALLTDHHIAGIADTPQVVVDDTRVRVGPIAALLNGHPSASLTAVGITGTNGKTTTAHLLEAVFDANGWRTGVVGTLHGPRTTPEAPELQRTLRRFVDDGADAAVLEVSSHALALHRVDGTRFDAVVFTNLGHDHLDLHGSQEEYFRAKARLFSPDFAPVGVVNVDDPYGQLLADASASSEAGREFRVVPTSSRQVSDVEVDAVSHRYRWRGFDVVVPIGGHFNVANSLAALTTAVELGIDPAVAVGALAGVAPVPGRFQLVRSEVADRRGVTVIVDYAHTPDGLAELLTSARSVTGRELTVVFGCGGERDHPKRPEMGRIAAQLADHVIVTSDNPRGEDPAAIVDDILSGVAPEYRRRIVTDVDRRNAIRTALESAGGGDVVIIAGKGHERIQEYADRTVDFDDVAVATELLEAMA